MYARLAALAAVAAMLSSVALAAEGEGQSAAQKLAREQWRLEVLLIRARAQLNADKVPDALQSCQKAAEIRLFDARVQSMFGEVYLRQGKWEETVVALRRSTHSERDNQMLARAATELGWARRDQGALDAAAKLWKEAVDADSSNPWAQSSLGLGYVMTGKPELGQHHCQLATELDGSWTGGWDNLGLARFACHDFAGAETAFRKALKLAPADASTLSDLAFVRFEQDAVGQALEIWQKLTADGAGTPDQLAGLAIGYWATGHKDQALAAYKQALGLDKSYAKPQSLAARHFWGDKAVKAAEELLAAMPK